MTQDLDFLKEVLSVPTVTYDEGRMVKYLCNWLSENKIPYYVDTYLNVYATKGVLENENEYYPLVISHTDTVHSIDSINIREEKLPNTQKQLKLSLKAYNDQGAPTGIGGDDKCGVFACLKLLKELPVLKAAFFVSEETGCHGSKNSDPTFFENVGYGIQFDAPENWMISENCSGQVLFDRDSDFFDKCDVVLTEGMNPADMRYMRHPYTDVYAVTKKYGIQTINFSIGYYRYHTPNEYVVVEDVMNGIEMGKKMISSLGYSLYEKKSDPLPQNWGISPWLFD
jgi:tripeptide aminopeptidase